MSNAPRKGQPIRYATGSRQLTGTVTSVEGNLCWCEYSDGTVGPFIWQFRDGLNRLHDWPTKNA